ncbi:MAG: acyl carrier protein [Spirochaetes bacterium]|uniref:Acyl carrier protein n=1 Tax=Candidatus Avitreponema avistercoris TaxID=2840705 RepID=A0A9D9ENJ5_9SPIR|nr:acyl carrier protein [Candidatus Avitreponema avistercoris]
MDNAEILQKLEAIFRDVLDNEEICLTEDTTADDIEEWDSLSHIQLIVAIEKGFGIKLSAREVRELADVGEMVLCIADKLQ